MLETAQSIVAYGIVIVLAAWLAGPTRWAISIRHALTPYLRRPGYAYGGLAVLLVLVFWWDPVIATHRLVPSLLLIAFAVLGTELLRRQVIREFPDHVTPGSPGGAGQGIADRIRGPRVATAGAPSGPPTRASARSSGWPGSATRARSPTTSSPRRRRASSDPGRAALRTQEPWSKLGAPTSKAAVLAVDEGAVNDDHAECNLQGRAQPELTVPESADRPWSGSRASVGSTRRQRSAPWRAPGCHGGGVGEASARPEALR